MNPNPERERRAVSLAPWERAGVRKIANRQSVASPSTSTTPTATWTSATSLNSCSWRASHNSHASHDSHQLSVVSDFMLIAIPQQNARAPHVVTGDEAESPRAEVLHVPIHSCSRSTIHDFLICGCAPTFPMPGALSKIKIVKTKRFERFTLVDFVQQT